MYQPVEEDELIEFCFENVRNNLTQFANCEPKHFNLYLISEGVFLCSISNDNNQLPQNIVLKLDKLNPLKNTLITSCKGVEVITAYEFYLNGLGPRLLSVFKNGRIEEWINGQPLSIRFRDDKMMQKLVAQCIASIHSIKTVPAEKNTNFLINKVNIFLKLIYKNKSNQNYTSLSNFINQQICETNLDKTAEERFNNDKISGLMNELNFLTNILTRLNCSNQIVFCHNDLSQENIFQRLDAFDKLYVLNYDLSGYNYRAYDIAHYLNNIAFNFNNPPININQLNLVTDEEMNTFLEHYLTKWNELKGETIDLNCLNKEVKFFKVYSSYLSILVSVLTTLTNQPIELNLAFLKLRIEVYLLLKNDFINSYPEFLKSDLESND